MMCNMKWLSSICCAKQNQLLREDETLEFWWVPAVYPEPPIIPIVIIIFFRLFFLHRFTDFHRFDIAFFYFLKALFFSIISGNPFPFYKERL
jgi:hypothetical protein